MKVVITGANGFLGKNLYAYFKNQTKYAVEKIVRGDSDSQIRSKIKDCDYLFHLAATNRTNDVNDFENFAPKTKKYYQGLPLKVIFCFCTRTYT